MSSEEKKTIVCEGVSCELEQSDEGLVIRVKSDDPETLKKMKVRFESCCTESEDCCK